MKTFKLHFIRNGKTEANEQGLYCGSTDSPLSERGRRELAELLEQGDYPYVDLVFCGPLSGDLETARMLYPECEIRVLDSLREADLGEFEGRSLEELKGDRNFQKWASPAGEFLPAGAEPPAEFISRICGGARQMVEAMMAEGVFSAAVVAHMSVIAGIFSSICYPKADPYDWTCDGGCGYTAIADPTLFMREPVMEVAYKVPFGDDREQQPSDEWDDSMWDPSWDSELLDR